MDIFDVVSLLGGLAMFLYGMRLMGDSLKENSSGTLKAAMEKVTNNSFKAFLLGIFITALIQSSTATIVITSGLVGAGILTLRQSLGIIVGANVGTTVTGQIIRLLDIDSSGTVWLRFFQPATLAPLALIIGIVLIMGHFVKNAKSVGNIAVGFGILFSGLLNMTGAVAKLTQSGAIEQLFSGLGENPFLGYLTGAGVAFVLQSSSATVGILQAFSASGLLTFKAIYAVIVGIYLGDCVTTAIVCSIGAKAEARRVGIVNILFNLSETVLVLVGVAVVHRLGLLNALWDRTANSGMIANTNTIFNLTCSICLFPMLGVYEKLSRRIVKDDREEVREEKYRDELEALNPGFLNTPALALVLPPAGEIRRGPPPGDPRGGGEHRPPDRLLQPLHGRAPAASAAGAARRHPQPVLQGHRRVRASGRPGRRHRGHRRGHGPERDELLAGGRRGAPRRGGRDPRDPFLYRAGLRHPQREGRPQDRADGADRQRAERRPPPQPSAPDEPRPLQRVRRQQLFQSRRRVPPHRCGVLERGRGHRGAYSP